MSERQEPMQVAIQALRAIYDGSQVMGRWIDQLTFDCPDENHHNPGEPPAGYYDADNEPEEDDCDGDNAPPYPYGTDVEHEDDLRLVGGQWLRPARWEEYTEEEQANWIESCGLTAREALEKLGALSSED